MMTWLVIEERTLGHSADLAGHRREDFEPQ